MQKIEKEKFDNVINTPDKTVIKFYVNWCPDCKRAEKFDPELEKEFGKNFSFYSVNCDEQGNLKNECEVRGFPSYLIYKSGEKTAHLHSKWAKSKDQVADFLSKNINGDFSLNKQV